MSGDIRNKLIDLSDYINNSALPHRFLPYVAESLNAMIEELDNTNMISDKLKNLARNLGIFISDDFEFSESETGTKILDVINSILRSEK